MSAPITVRGARLQNLKNIILSIPKNQLILGSLKPADWIVDLGPEGSSAEGVVIAESTTEKAAQFPTSYTGRYLRDILKLS